MSNERTYFVIQYCQFGDSDSFRIVNHKPLKTWEDAKNLQNECLAGNPDGRYVIKADDED